MEMLSVSHCYGRVSACLLGTLDLLTQIRRLCVQVFCMIASSRDVFVAHLILTRGNLEYFRLESWCYAKIHKADYSQHNAMAHLVRSEEDGTNSSAAINFAAIHRWLRNDGLAAYQESGNRGFCAAFRRKARAGAPTGRGANRTDSQNTAADVAGIMSRRERARRQEKGQHQVHTRSI
ncbi:hypothetical protein [Paracoccus sp. (in: a-proteobacteria)]|uniref:hypothetical protein n=1 Tax=Paracoccus sp. TaxID=267 RepID=UPI0035B13C4A